MSTCLVTGGAGFIGSHMTDRLIELGHAVVVIDNESTGFRSNVPPGARYLKADVTNSEALRPAFEHGIDAVFHIAGQASTIRSFDDPHSDLDTNVAGTINVLQHCLEYRVPRLLFASSMTAYGHPARVPVPEEEPCRPIAYYGITKYAAERYVIATGQRNDLDFEFQTMAFRMFNVYGERQRLDNPYQGVLGFFMGCVLRDEPIPIHGDGTQTRDFVYIGDVAAAWLAAWQSTEAHGQVYNLGSGHATSIAGLAAAVIEACEQDPAKYPLDKGPLRPGDQRHMAADISAARTALAWQPKVSLRQGLARTAAWARLNVDERTDG